MLKDAKAFSGFYPKEGHPPATFTILNFPVDDIEAAVDELNPARCALRDLWRGDQNRCQGYPPLSRCSARRLVQRPGWQHPVPR